MDFDAFAAIRAINDAYVGFLTDHFRISRGDEIGARVRELWSSDLESGLFGEPIVEARWSYPPGATVQALESQGVLSSPSVAMWGQRRPQFFQHQEDAIRAGVAGKTVVLSAGTGSGKTEAFLVPLLERLYRAHEAGEDDLSKDGVRALIVYPLNALVDDQLERIAKVLAPGPAGVPPLRFGHYTGRLPENANKTDILASGSKVIDRKTLRDRPPHILVTNYVMLQYMLLRPQDASIFTNDRILHRSEGRAFPRLRTIVLDEAHVYVGAQAAEVHLLLRRACERFGTTLERVQGFATSATLSGAVKPDEALAEFGARMFAKSLGEEGEGGVQAVVARYDEPTPWPDAFVADGVGGAGALSDAELTLWEADSWEEAHTSAWARLVELGFIAAGAPGAGVPRLHLGRALSANLVLRRVREALWRQRLWALGELGKEALGTPVNVDQRAWLVSLLGLAARARLPEAPLLATRIHAFLRAPAGVTLALPGEVPSAWVSRLSTAPSDPDVVGATLWCCELCGAFAIGRVDAQGVLGGRGWAFPSFTTDVEASRPAGPLAEYLGEQPIVFRECVGEQDEKDGDDDPDRAPVVEDCPGCGTASARMKELAISPELAMGVVVDALYAKLPAQPRIASPGHLPYPGQRRKLVAMFDNRQGAARAGARIEATHDRIYLRQRILREIRTRPDGFSCGELATNLSNHLDGAAGLKDLFTAAEAEVAQGRKGAATSAIYEEFVVNAQRGGSLESLGLVTVEYPGLSTLAAPTFWSATPDAWRQFVAEICDHLRARGATTNPPTDDFPFYRKDRGFQRSIGDSPKSIRLIVDPAHNDRSQLYQFAQHVAKALGGAVDGNNLLNAVWDGLANGAENGSLPFVRIRKYAEDEVHAGVLSIDWQALRFMPSSPAWYSSASRAPLPRSVCVGEERYSLLAGPLATVKEPDDTWRAEWARRYPVLRVQTTDQALWAVENTAATGAVANADALRRFREGSYNLMSCSTTLEMGIDLDGLNAVLLGNVPPSASNYWQRAGRAGRRGEGSTLVLTVAMPRLHDQAVFANPLRLLDGPILAPQVVLDGEELIGRHVNAWALQQFLVGPCSQAGVLGANPAFGKVKGAMVEPWPGLNGLAGDTFVDKFVTWLCAGDSAVEARLGAFLAGTRLAGRPLRELLRRVAGDFADVQDDVQLERQQLVEDRQQEVDQGREHAGKAIDCLLAEMDDDVLVSALVHRGLLPRFGFAVDIVAFDTRWMPPGKKVDGVEYHPAPERDLRIALGEYAPSAQVVVGGKVHTVAGLDADWNHGESIKWRRRLYLICDGCGALHTGRVLPPRCPVCHADLVAPFENPSATAEDHAKMVLGADAKFVEAEVADCGGGRPRGFLVPTRFRARWGMRPPLYRHTRTVLRPGRSTVTLASAAGQRFEEVIPRLLAAAWVPASEVLIRQEGKGLSLDDGTASPGFGFAICQSCGCAAPERAWHLRRGAQGQWRVTDPPKAVRDGHHRPRGGTCHGKAWRNAVLGNTHRVDTLRVRLLGQLAIPVDKIGDGEQLALTLAALMVPAAASMLQVDPRVLTPLVAPVRDGDDWRYEGVLAEESGSGLLARIADRVPELLDRALTDLFLAAGRIDLARFDNQFALGQGDIRPDVLRTFFTDARREVWREAYAAWSGAAHDGVGLVLNGIPWAVAVGEVMSAGGGALLAADHIGDQLGWRSVLGTIDPAVRAQRRPRLLLGRWNPNGESLDAQLALAPLLRAVAAGDLEIRVLKAPDAMREHPWRISGSWVGRPAVLGLRRSGGGVVPELADQLGEGAGAGAVVVRARPAEDTAARAWLEAQWTNATPATLIGADKVVCVHDGDISPTVFRDRLEAVLGRPLGPILALKYVDVYALHEADSIRSLFTFLRELPWAKGASVNVTTGIVLRTSSRAAVPAVALTLSNDQAEPLIKEQLASTAETCAGVQIAVVRRDIAGDVAREYRSPGVIPQPFEQAPLPHGRRLSFTMSGGTVEVLLDKGLAAFKAGHDGVWCAQNTWFAVQARHAGPAAPT